MTDLLQSRMKRDFGPYSLLMLTFICVLLPASFSNPALAMEITGKVALDAVMMTGQSTNRTTFEGGVSKLQWPIDVKGPSISAGVTRGDFMDLDFGLFAEPWGSNNRVMKDFDYLDEGEFPGRLPHDGVDIYSETDLDSKALAMSVHSRVFPLRSWYLSAGLTAGYRYEEYDYRGYNTRQTGYGSWQDQTNTVSGPSSFYTVEYDIYSAGVALQSHVEDILLIALEASWLPLVYGSDEDEHLRRNRVTFTNTTGSGYQTSLKGSFTVAEGWAINSECLYARIATDGHQSQYWYGDDPATPSFNDTGYKLSGIDAELNQENFRFAIGTTCRF
jgi:hypothetical protein